MKNIENYTNPKVGDLIVYHPNRPTSDVGYVIKVKQVDIGYDFDVKWMISKHDVTNENTALIGKNWNDCFVCEVQKENT